MGLRYITHPTQSSLETEAADHGTPTCPTNVSDLKASLHVAVKTINILIFRIFFYTDYMNENMNGRTSTLSEVLNPKYEDLSQVRATALHPSSQSFNRLPEKPEYQNTPHGPLLLAATESLNLDHEADFLPQATTVPTVHTSNGNTLLPAAENLEYLGLGAPVQATIQ